MCIKGAISHIFGSRLYERTERTLPNLVIIQQQAFCITPKTTRLLQTVQPARAETHYHKIVSLVPLYTVRVSFVRVYLLWDMFSLCSLRVQNANGRCFGTLSENLYL